MAISKPVSIKMHIMLILLLCQNLSLAQKTDSITLNKIDSLITLLDSKDAPGGAISIIQDGNTTYRRYFGMQDLKKKIPVSASTHFNMASISKQFTAMCIALLEEQGKIDIENDIKMYFPDFNYTNSIKVKNLLNHSSGIRESTVIAVLAGNVNLKGELPKKKHNKEFLFEILKKEKDLNFPTGSEMSYTNINYVLLADIVEQVSGMRFKNFVDSAIFKPLKMKSSYVENTMEPSSVFGYYYNGKKFKKKHLQAGTYGDDNLVSTLDDLEKWNANFFDNKLGNKNKNLIRKFTTSIPLNDGEKSNYGYGLSIGFNRGLKRFSHDGENNLHTTFIFNVPEKRTSITFLVNATNYINPIDQAYKIIDLLFPESPEKIQEKIDSENQHETIKNSELKNLMGLYYEISENGTAQIRNVTYSNNQLLISKNPDTKGCPHTSVNKNEFIPHNSLGHPNQVLFNKDNDEITFTEHFDEGPYKQEDNKFKKVKVDNLDYPSYAGTYLELNHNSKIKIKSKKGKIIAKKSILKIPLIPIEKDKFYSPDYQVLFIFKRNESNQIKSLLINSWNFRNFNLIKK